MAPTASSLRCTGVRSKEKRLGKRGTTRAAMRFVTSCRRWECNCTTKPICLSCPTGRKAVTTCTQWIPSRSPTRVSRCRQRCRHHPACQGQQLFRSRRRRPSLRKCGGGRSSGRRQERRAIIRRPTGSETSSPRWACSCKTRRTHSSLSTERREATICIRRAVSTLARCRPLFRPPRPSCRRRSCLRAVACRSLMCASFVSSGRRPERITITRSRTACDKNWKRWACDWRTKPTCSSCRMAQRVPTICMSRARPSRRLRHHRASRWPAVSPSTRCDRSAS
mmetsp:Transcript_20450/g.56739  ORF Transcript_20450/g.56739 Transcript_20450/m.56739 type:complete len:280 (-) Transcript_20450:993-1832(-)